MSWCETLSKKVESPSVVWSLIVDDLVMCALSCLQVDKVTGRFNGQFKTYAICGAIRRMVRKHLNKFVAVQLLSSIKISDVWMCGQTWSWSQCVTSVCCGRCNYGISNSTSNLCDIRWALDYIGWNIGEHVLWITVTFSGTGVCTLWLFDPRSSSFTWTWRQLSCFS